MDAATIGFVVIAVVVLLIIARLAYRLVLGQSMTRALIDHDNQAAAVALAGFLLGVIQVIIPILSGPGHSFWADMRGVALYGIGGIIAMTAAGLIFEQYSVRTGVKLREEVAKNNLAAGIVDGAIHFASGQIVAGALTGDGGAIMPTVVFWVAGFVALILLTQVFRLLTGYNDSRMINEGNVAAALGSAGLIISIGMMVGYAVSGTFTGYAEGFRSFGLMLLVVFFLYPVRQIIVQTILLGGGFSLWKGRLDAEIADDRNVGAGLLEAVGYLATALVVTNIF